MSLGKEWTGTDWNSAGLCVNTDGRIWLDACGTTSDSTLSALSNDVSGQLLMQSLSSNVFLIANDANTVSASGSIFIAGANSIRLFSAHGTTGVFSGFTEELLSGEALSTVVDWFGDDPNYNWVDNDSIGTDYFDRIGPSETTANSNTATSYVNHCDEVSDTWTIAILAQSIWTVAMELGFMLFGVVGAGGTASKVALAGQFAALGTWLGMRGVAEIMSEPGPAGLDMYTMGAISFASPGFTSLYSGMGIVMTSGFSVGGLGLVSASLNGGLGAVLKSPWRIGLDGKAAEAIAGTSLTLEAKKELNMMGSNVQVGAVGGESLTQIPTVSIDAISIKDLNVVSTANVSQLAGGTAGYGAPTIKVVGKTHIVLKNASYAIDISLTGISISILKATKIETTASGLIADCMAGMAVEIDASGVLIGSSSSFLGVDAVGCWSWQGPLTTMM